MKKNRVTDVDPDDIQMDKGDFDGTVNSNVDDYAEYLSAKHKFGDKHEQDEEDTPKPVKLSMTQVEKLHEADKAQMEVTPIDTNAPPPKEQPAAPVPKPKEDDKVEAFGDEYLSVEQMARAASIAQMSTKEKEHSNAALSDNDDEPDTWDY